MDQTDCWKNDGFVEDTIAQTREMEHEPGGPQSAKKIPHGLVYAHP